MVTTNKTYIHTAFGSFGLPAEGLSTASVHVNQADFLFFQSPLVYEGRNDNGDVFTAQELLRSYATLIGMPLDIDHKFDVQSACGRIIDASYKVEHGLGVVRIVGGILKDYDHGLLVKKIANGIITGISMECLFERPEFTHQGRVLHGVKFIGAGHVRTPAEPKAHITEPLSTQPSTLASRRQQVIASTVAAYLQAVA